MAAEWRAKISSYLSGWTSNRKVLAIAISNGAGWLQGNAPRGNRQVPPVALRRITSSRTPESNLSNSAVEPGDDMYDRVTSVAGCRPN